MLNKYIDKMWDEGAVFHAHSALKLLAQRNDVAASRSQQYHAPRDWNRRGDNVVHVLGFSVWGVSTGFGGTVSFSISHPVFDL